MKLELEFVELHTPLFFGGINFGTKLDPTKRTTMRLVYDRTEKELWVYNKDKYTIVPRENVANMTPIDQTRNTPKFESPKETVVQPRAPGRPKAQVSTPTSHVFADGPGRTNE